MTSCLLAYDLGDFLASWYGILIFVVLDILFAVTLVAIGYKHFFKGFFDFTFGLVATLVTLPVWLCIVIISKVHIIRTNEYSEVFKKTYVVGKGGKVIALRSFTVEDGLEGNLTALGLILRKTGLEYLPRVFDLLFLRMSIVGIKPLEEVDEKFIGEGDYERFNARTGFLNPVPHDTDGSYEGLFKAESNYAQKVNLFKDVAVIFTAFLQKMRGEKTGVEKLQNASYARYLLEKGEITQADYDEAINEGQAETEVEAG